VSVRKTRRYFRTELIKMYTNISFVIMIIFTAVIYMTNTIYIDSMSTKSYNMFQIIGMKNRKENLKAYGISFESIFLGTGSGYISMFGPVIAAVPFVMLFSNARKNTNVRFEIMRTGKKEYLIGKFLSAMVCGGSVIMLGYLLYGLVSLIVLPGAKEQFEIDEVISGFMAVKSVRYLYGKLGIGILYLVRSMEMFVYGMTSVMLTMLISAFVHNKYLVLCIPFMLNYFWSGLINKYLSRSVLIQYCTPSYPSMIFHLQWNEGRRVLVFWTSFMLIILALSYIVMEKRCDCGE